MKEKIYFSLFFDWIVSCLFVFLFLWFRVFSPKAFWPTDLFARHFIEIDMSAIWPVDCWPNERAYSSVSQVSFSQVSFSQVSFSQVSFSRTTSAECLSYYCFSERYLSAESLVLKMSVFRTSGGRVIVMAPFICCCLVVVSTNQCCRKFLNVLSVVVKSLQRRNKNTKIF